MELETSVLTLSLRTATELLCTEQRQNRCFSTQRTNSSSCLMPLHPIQARRTVLVISLDVLNFLQSPFLNIQTIRWGDFYLQLERSSFFMLFYSCQLIYTQILNHVDFLFVFCRGPKAVLLLKGEWAGKVVPHWGLGVPQHYIPQPALAVLCAT